MFQIPSADTWTTRTVHAEERIRSRERIHLPNGWRPRWYQQPLWDAMTAGARRAYVIAHRRWGKDDVALHWTAYAAHQRVGSYWHTLPQYSQARKAIWTAVNPHTGKRRIDEAFPLELREKTLEQDMFIRFKNGSTWQLVGSDNFNTLVGAGPAGVTISEWALANPAAWGYMQPMLIENDGWAMFITTPRGRNHGHSMYNRAVSSMAEGGEWWVTLQDINYTKALSEQQQREALADYVAMFGKDIGQAQFEQEYLCSFNAAILGAYYAHEMRALREKGGIRITVPVPGQPVHRAWDIGVKDDTSIIWFQVQGGRPVIIDAYTNNGRGVEHYAKEIFSRPWQTEGSIDWVPHDAQVREWGTGKTRIETMLSLGLKPRLVPSASKEDGIEAARKTLAVAAFDHRASDTLVAALEQYRREWDDERRTFRASEYRDWTTHLSDAFRYLSLSWRDTPQALVIERRKQPAGTVVLEGPPKPTKGRIKV